MKQHYIRSQQQISFVKEMFSRQLAQQLGLMEVQAPILSRVGDGTQDNLSGHENAVQVKVKTLPQHSYEVVHSLAKWKRQTLGRFGFGRIQDSAAVLQRVVHDDRTLRDQMTHQGAGRQPPGLGDHHRRRRDHLRMP